MKIRYYLSLMVGAVLVPVIAFSAIALKLMLDAERDAALKGVREVARTSLVSIDRELTNSQSALRMLSVSTHLSNGDYAEFYEKARYADQFGSTITALLGEDGQLLLTTSVPYGTPLPPTQAKERVTRVLESNQPQVSNLLRTSVTRREMAVVDVPITTKSGRRYVLSQGYDISHFNRVLRQVNTPNGWLIGVFDRNGMTIAQTGGAAQPALREAIRNKTVGVIRNSDDGNVKLYTVMERSALSGWTVAVGVPEAEIEAVARRAIGVSLLGLLAAFGCAGATAWLFAPPPVDLDPQRRPFGQGFGGRRRAGPSGQLRCRRSGRRAGGDCRRRRSAQSRKSPAPARRRRARAPVRKRARGAHHGRAAEPRQG